MSVLWLDIETFSSTDIRESGVYRYADDPTFMVLCGAWAVDDGSVQVAESEEDFLRAVGSMLGDPDVLKVAHNANFERTTLAVATGMDMPPEQWLCTAVTAASFGFPRTLDGFTEWSSGERKDSAGTHLVRWFCVPYRGRRRLPEDHPEKWQAFIEYCRQDVVSMRDATVKLPVFPVDDTTVERRMWVLDQKINDRGIPVDVELARTAEWAGKQNARAAVEQARRVLRAARADVLVGFGLSLPNLRADTVEAFAARKDLTPVQHELLSIRQNLALSASKKFTSALNRVSDDGRLRGSLLFHGAHTGRWAGRGTQLQNLPRAQFKTEEATADAVERVKAGKPVSPEELKMLVRSMFVGPFTVADLAAIEARVLAWLSGEEWRLEAFRAGRDIYVELAVRLGLFGGRDPEGVPDDVYDDIRQQGKTADLAAGYQGALGAFRAWGAEGSDDELLSQVRAYRAANPRIVSFWHDLERAFKFGGTAGRIEVERRGAHRKVILPSGRALWYQSVSVTEDSVSYRHERYGKSDTYGGKLTENVTQAVARDILVDGMLRIDAAGIPLVAHVHDEAISEGKRDPKVLTDLMSVSPSWAPDLPLAAKGFVCQRYRKD